MNFSYYCNTIYLIIIISNYYVSIIGLLVVIHLQTSGGLSGTEGRPEQQCLTMEKEHNRPQLYKSLRTLYSTKVTKSNTFLLYKSTHIVQYQGN